MSGVVRIAQPGPDAVAAVRRIAPLSAGLMIECGPFEVPAGVLASSTTLEQDDSEEGRIAREFVIDDRWRGMGSVSPGGWMLLGRDDDVVVIGQRQGAVGMGAVVELQRRARGFEARAMGGWRLRPRAPSRQIEACSTARTGGRTVTLDWTSGQDLHGVPDRVRARVELVEESENVHVLLSSEANDERRSPDGWTVGTGRAETASFTLEAPLGSRRLLSGHRIPPVVVLTD